MISTKLTFYGACKEALEFYRQLFDGEITKEETFKNRIEAFPMGLDVKYENLIFSAELRILQGNDTCYISIGASGACKDNVAFDIILENAAEIQNIYDKLMENGGKSNVPLGETKEYTLFGSMIDKFGVCWTLYCIR